jgi:hypothetical protein
MAYTNDAHTRTRLFVSTIVIAGGTLARSIYELYSNFERMDARPRLTVDRAIAIPEQAPRIDVRSPSR